MQGSKLDKRQKWLGLAVAYVLCLGLVWGIGSSSLSAIAFKVAASIVLSCFALAAGLDMGERANTTTNYSVLNENVSDAGVVFSGIVLVIVDVCYAVWTQQLIAQVALTFIVIASTALNLRNKQLGAKRLLIQFGLVAVNTVAWWMVPIVAQAVCLVLIVCMVVFLALLGFSGYIWAQYEMGRQSFQYGLESTGLPA